MITKTDTQLSKLLIEKQLIGAEAIMPFLDESSKHKEGLYAILLKKNAVPEEGLLKTLSEVLQVPVLDPGALKPEPAAIEKVPLKFAEYYKILPLKIEKRKLTIAISYPPDLRTQDDMRAHLGLEVQIVLAREKDIQEAVKKAYGFAAGTIGEIMAATPAQKGEVPAAEGQEKIENLEKMVGDASIVKLVNQIILEAYKKRASDIHIEPYRGKVKLRYRIDGVLYNANVQAEMSRLILPILSRIKIMSSLNIVEKRLPQDGRAIVKVEDTQLDLRVSSIPTPYGESVVIRMLPMNRVFDLNSLGLNAEQKGIFEELIERPNGIIFITGPTGSGKSTTLYACLNRINTDERKIITIEDPVEYEMEGVTQIQVVSQIGLDFARGLRSCLRHDPDVMMVGEVRDLETAEIAIRVALTGHLVFSTLHTNDAASGVTRLLDIGVQPYLIASSVQAFVAQRLVRVICPHCKQEDKSPAAAEIKKVIARDMGMKESEVKIHRGKGCDKCNDTGFWGRLAVYELLLLNEKLRTLIMKRAEASDIKRLAVSQGMQTLKQDGWRKVMAGLTTPEEILEIAEEEKEAEAQAEAEAGADSAEPVRERRAFKRVEYKTDMKYQILKSRNGEEKGAEKKAVTRSLSAGGLVFICDEEIPEGAIVEVRIDLDGSKVESLAKVDCLARVTRAEKDGEKRWENAVCFLDMPTSDRSRLEKFIEKQKD